MPLRSARLALGLALLLAAPLPTLAQPIAWDQERATSLAGELAAAMKEVKSTARKDSYIRDGYRSGDPVISRFASALDGIERSSRQLAKRLGEGEGREQTLPVAKKIRSLVRDAEVQGARIMTPSWLEEKLVPAERLLDELGTYYFGDFGEEGSE